MLSTIISGGVYGIHSHLIRVEVDVSQGLPCFQIVGLPGSEVREARERVKVALKNVGVKLPPVCINVNLSPADMPKSGTMFDLPVAVGIMTALSMIPEEAPEDTLLIGELGLSGEVKPVKGVLPIVREAARCGIRRCILPASNVWEGALVREVESIGVENIRDAVSFLTGCELEDSAVIHSDPVDPETFMGQEAGEEDIDFADISGQEGLKRAAEVAAAGFHHLLIIGPPGSGKTMLARRLSTILPPLSLEESLEVSTIYSISGLLQSAASLKTTRPFLNPHHTITGRALAGGGRVPMPGLISLAHRGVLFLDELPEFKRETLDILRQPLEDKKVQIARSGGTYIYPADFMLVGAMNIATPKLIQCRIAEMAENKAFHGFCGCDFLLFRSAVMLHGLSCPALLHLFLTIARQSLNHSKGEFMFTKKEKRLIGEGDFTIIRETERYIEFLSNNTKHCWIICKNLDGTDKPIMLYHKHSQKTKYYHKHWKTWSVVKAVESIKQHDGYVLGTAASKIP